MERVGRGAAGALPAEPFEKEPGREPAPFLDHLLSPALSSTFCGGEGDQSSPWDRSGKDDEKSCHTPAMARAFPQIGNWQSAIGNSNWFSIP
jgi:hypothetical protein